MGRGDGNGSREDSGVGGNDSRDGGGSSGDGIVIVAVMPVVIGDGSGNGGEIVTR